MSDETYVCEVCQKETKIKAALQNHILWSKDEAHAELKNQLRKQKENGTANINTQPRRDDGAMDMEGEHTTGAPSAGTTLDMRGKLLQVLRKAGITQKADPIADILLNGEPEDPEYFWTTLADARIDKIARSMAFNLWFQRSPEEAVQDGDMDEEVLDYRPGMRPERRPRDEDDDYDDEDDDGNGMFRSQYKMLKQQLRMQQMRSMLRQMREDAEMDRMERQRALGIAPVNPQTGQPVMPYQQQPQEQLVDYVYNGMMLKVTPTQMMMYERMRRDDEQFKLQNRPDPSKEKKNVVLPDGTMTQMTTDEYNAACMAYKRMDDNKLALLAQQGTKEAEARRLEQTMREQKEAYDRNVQDMQRRFEEDRRQMTERLERLTKDQQMEKMNEELRRTQQYVAQLGQKNQVDEYAAMRRKLLDAGIGESHSEDKKMAIEATKVEKGLEMVSKQLGNTHGQLNKLTDTVEFAIKENVKRQIQAEQGPPPAQTDYEIGDANAPPPEVPPAPEQPANPAGTEIPPGNLSQ